MQLSYGQVKEGSAAIASAMAAARSARNLASRRRAEDARDERETEHHRRRKRKSDKEIEMLLRRKTRVHVPKEERPKIGTSTARKLYHRTIDQLMGTTGLSDARGRDGLNPIHYSFTARGFASTKGRRWREGEAERAARYIVREEGLEGGERGWWSSIADDRNELVAFYRASEALERHDRSNANVYMTEIIALPAELSARQRRKAVRRICRFFDKRCLPYTVAIHVPDGAGDQRNFHVHILYSLRPCERHGPYDWSFGVAKEGDINTKEGITARRQAVVQAINTTLCSAGSAKRYTHLSNKARGIAAGQAKVGQTATWIARRLEALEKNAARLRSLSMMLSRAREVLGKAGPLLQRQREFTADRLRNLHDEIETGTESSRAIRLKAVCSERLSASAQSVSRDLTNGSQAVAGAKGQVVSRLDNRAGMVVHRDATQRLPAARTAVGEHLRLAEARVFNTLASNHGRFAHARLVLIARLGLQATLVRGAAATRKINIDAIRNRAARHAHLDKLSSDLHRETGASRELLHLRRGATGEHLQELDGRVRRAIAEAEGGRIRLAGLGAIAKVSAKRARLLEQEAAIQQVVTTYGDAVTEARKVVASSMLAAGEAIKIRILASIARLADLKLEVKRINIDRFDAVSANLNDVISSVASRMFAARQSVRARLERMSPEAAPTMARAAKPTLLGRAAEQRFAVFARSIERTIDDADRRLGPLRQAVSMLNGSTNRVERSHDTPTPHRSTSPPSDAQRGSERRKAIAAVAWQLRRSSFPPQIRTATGYAISPTFVGSFLGVDRFEAEDVIQKVHVRKRAEMLVAVRRKVEGAERSPFVDRDGSMRLPLDTFSQPLRRAVELAINDPDLVQNVDQSLLLWRDRETAMRKARARKELDADDRRDRMRPRVQEVFKAINQQILEGGYSKLALTAMRGDILVVSRAIGEGRLAMRSLQGASHFYCESEELRAVVATLADSAVGRDVIVALGQLTLDEQFDLTELASTWALPHVARLQRAAQLEMDDADITVLPGKGGAER